MSGGQSGEKTEKPTAERLKKARSEGQTPRTPDLAAWAVVGVGCLLLPQLAADMSQRMAKLFAMVSVVAADPQPAVALRALRDGATDAAIVMLPLVAATAIAAIAGTGLQGGIHLAWANAKPKFSRLDPVKGFKQRYGLTLLWEAFKTTTKTLILGLVTWLAVQAMLPTVIASGALPLSSSIDMFRSAAASLMQTCVVVGVLLAGGDYVFQRRKVMKDIKMSKQEIKDENRRTEGDPQVKAQRRSMALAMSRSRMMSEVATADVVLVNPTHVAVALRYDPSRGAPRVVAKGRGHMARRIRELATEHDIPMVADVPLARALHDACTVGQEIPAALYGAVAEILAFLMSLRRMGRSTSADEPLRVPQTSGRRIG